MKLKSYFLTRKNINEVHQSPYNDTAALKTVSQINNKNDFNINAIYYNKNAECFWMKIVVGIYTLLCLVNAWMD